MIYDDLDLPTYHDRPFIYSNFVSTLDGKVQVLNSPGYWPIGSRNDYQGLLELRSKADILIHGRKTAEDGSSVVSLKSEAFLALRKRAGKQKLLTYLVITNNPTQELIDTLAPYGKDNVYIATNKITKLPSNSSQVTILQLGEEKVDFSLLIKELYQRGYKKILVEGGPQIMGEFFKEDLIDELFLTLSPKIYGGENGKTLTMVEGSLLPPDKTKQYRLVSTKQVDNELFLRYTR